MPRGVLFRVLPANLPGPELRRWYDDRHSLATVAQTFFPTWGCVCRKSRGDWKL